MTSAGRSAKQAQILEAARQLFLECGFDGASTDAITQRAHVSKETLYRYYRSKEELLVAVMRDMTVERVLPPAMAALPPVPTRCDLEAALKTWMKAAMDRFMDPVYLALCRLTFGESARRPQLVELFRRGVPEAGGQALATLLEDARRRGLLREDMDAGIAARLLIGPLLSWGLMDGLMAGGRPPQRPSQESLDEVVRLFLEGTAVRGPD